MVGQTPRGAGAGVGGCIEISQVGSQVVSQVGSLLWLYSWRLWCTKDILACEQAHCCIRAMESQGYNEIKVVVIEKG